MEPDWKKAGKDCGRLLDRATLTALQGLNVAVSDNISTLKSKILQVLPVRDPYPINRPLAWDLAVVVKYGLPIYESIIICFGSTPFKEACWLPNKSVMTIEEVRQYHPKLRDIGYDGDFVQMVLLSDTDTSSRHCFVYVYSFTETVGCSEIGQYHYNLPAPTPSKNPITRQDISKTISLGAGNAFMHMNANATSIRYQPNGTMCIEFDPEVNTPDGSEDERTTKLIDHLKCVLPSRYDTSVTISKVDKKQREKNCNFCYFTEGGDFKISKSQTDFLVMTKTEDTECRSDSPIGIHECRETLNVECKCSQTKSNAEFRFQLQASMYNLLVREFMEKLRSLDEFQSLLDLEKISMYGLSFGISRPVEVLKIIVDFKQTCLMYEKKYENPTSLPKEGLIDGVITAVLDRISKRSPSPN